MHKNLFCERLSAHTIYSNLPLFVKTRPLVIVLGHEP